MVMKKTAMLVLALVMAFSLASCATGTNSDIPNGMQIASVAGADYYLYVPTTWNLNTHYGISGAYFNLRELSNVSMERYEQTESMKAEMQAAALEDRAGARIAWYYTNACRPVLEKQAFKDSIEEQDLGAAETTLDGVNAMQYQVKATVAGKACRFHYVIAERANAFYVFTFAVTEELYEMLWTNVQDMLSAFRFLDEPYRPGEMKPIDGEAEAPEGMKLASNDEVAYSFYVPSEWIVNQNDRVFSAYVESDRANVSVVPYMPEVESMKVADFVKETEEKLREMLGSENYIAVAEQDLDRTLGGRPAIGLRYRLMIDGKSFEYLQVIAAYKSMIYSVTYTAPTEDIFNQHLAEVESILAAFVFR